MPALSSSPGTQGDIQSLSHSPPTPVTGSGAPLHTCPHPGPRTYKPESLVSLQGEPVHQVAGFVGTIRQHVADMRFREQRHWGQLRGRGMRVGVQPELGLV